MSRPDSNQPGAAVFPQSADAALLAGGVPFQLDGLRASAVLRDCHGPRYLYSADRHQQCRVWQTHPGRVSDRERQTRHAIQHTVTGEWSPGNNHRFVLCFFIIELHMR